MVIDILKRISPPLFQLIGWLAPRREEFTTFVGYGHQLQVMTSEGICYQARKRPTSLLKGYLLSGA